MNPPEAEAVKTISMLLLVLTSAGVGCVARSYLGSLALSATVFIMGQLVLDFAGVLQEKVFAALFDPPLLLGPLVVVWLAMAVMWMIGAGASRIVRGSRRAAAGSRDAGERTDHG